MKRILVVDDEPDNLELMRRRLSSRGYEVLLAATASEALALAIEQQPRVILMDIRMPEIDGNEATRMLKTEPKTAQIPVVVLTADATKEVLDKAISCGAVDYELKPPDMSRLVQKLELLMQPPAAGGL